MVFKDAAWSAVKVLATAGLDTEEGTLYPLLRRLESQGLLVSEWDTAGKRPRKYYLLSDQGRTALEQLEDVWSEISAAVAAVLGQRASVESE